MKNGNLFKAERFLRKNIPLTRAMDLRVVSDLVHAFAIEAPVAPNHNHLLTAFGGSINAVATLAGYAFLWLELQDEEVQLVVSASSIRFLSPVRETIRAVCDVPDPQTMRNFRQSSAAREKAVSSSRSG